MCEEIRQVINNGNTFTFTSKKTLEPVIGEEVLTTVEECYFHLIKSQI
ncbi:MAG: hypothetical protein V7L01_11115 [Nostoc sp.]